VKPPFTSTKGLTAPISNWNYLLLFLEVANCGSSSPQPNVSCRASYIPEPAIRILCSDPPNKPHHHWTRSLCRCLTYLRFLYWFPLTLTLPPLFSSHVVIHCEANCPLLSRPGNFPSSWKSDGLCNSMLLLGVGKWGCGCGLEWSTKERVGVDICRGYSHPSFVLLLPSHLPLHSSRQRSCLHAL
jgi:hypothetical protein